MDYFIGFVLLLGVLVFIHELGHFLAAKWCGIRCDIFSVGMGPKILKFTKGETQYALSILPLGGYVKLFGQDPREEVSSTLEGRSFRHKPLLQRAFVVIAGPLANLLLAIVVFAALMMNGFPSEAPTLARVLPNSPAAGAGFKTGDKVLEMKWEHEGHQHTETPIDQNEVFSVISKNAGTEMTFVVASKNGEQRTISYSPELIEQRNPTTGIIEELGGIAGVEASAPAPVLSAIAPKSWASERMVPTPFWVESLSYGDEKIETKNAFALEQAWQKATNDLGSEKGSLSLNGRWLEEGKEAKEETISLSWSNKSNAPSAELFANGFYTYNALRLIDVLDGSAASEIGLQKGDIITSLGGAPVSSFYSFRNRLQTLAAQKDNIEVSWLRGDETISKEFSPQKNMTEDPLTGQSKEQFQIGASFVPFDAPPEPVIVQNTNIFAATVYGVNKSFSVSGAMLKSFYYLITGQLSRKALSGPFMIGKIAGDSYRAGWVPFLRMMAFISLNLFLLNLFPIPVLDGGHLLMFGVEALTRKPLSIKFLERWTMAGFVFLLGLMIYVSVNDLIRMWNS